MRDNFVRILIGFEYWFETKPFKMDRMEYGMRLQQLLEPKFDKTMRSLGMTDKLLSEI